MLVAAAWRALRVGRVDVMAVRARLAVGEVRRDGVAGGRGAWAAHGGGGAGRAGQQVGGGGWGGGGGAAVGWKGGGLGGGADRWVGEAEYAADDDQRYQAYRRAADILVNQLSDGESAIGPAQRAQELRPDDHETTVLLADVLTQSGRAEDAAAMLEQMADQLPYLVGMMMEVAHDDPDSTLGWCDDQTEFEFGLDLILDGLERLRTKA